MNSTSGRREEFVVLYPLLLGLAAALVLTCCGQRTSDSERRVTTSPNSTTREEQANGAISTSELDQRAFHPTDLSIAPTNDRSAAVVEAVEALHGEVIENDDVIGVRARFPVENSEQLIAVRDELRARGFVASLIALRTIPDDPDAPS